MFKEAIVIGRIFGIPVKIHFTFLLIIPFLAWVLGGNFDSIAERAGIPLENLLLNPYLSGLIMALALFVSVLLHEAAHSRVAQKQGIAVNSITLMLFGGVAHIDEGLEDPKKEALIAMSGPLTSLIIGATLLVAFSVYPLQFFPDLRVMGIYLGQINIFLAFFNLIPAFPTDGGRILRSLLARRSSYLDATRIATTVGQVFAFLFILLGLLLGNFILIFIAVFIFMGASQEYRQTLDRITLSNFKVKDLMTKDVSIIDENATVKELLERILAELHSGYPVFSAGKLKGCVTIGDTSKVDPARRNEYRVKDIMSRDIKKVSPDDSVYQVLKKLSSYDIGRLMVFEKDELVGIITRSDIMKGFRLRGIQKDFS
jgi:Zn-dependent protease/predicted transcriptional regulator